VEQAENGEVALKMMLNKKYKTVFMDVNMPIMNGDEAVREYWKRSPPCSPTNQLSAAAAAANNESSYSSSSADSSNATFSSWTNASRNHRSSVEDDANTSNHSYKYSNNSDSAIEKVFYQEEEEEGDHPKIVMLTGNITDADRALALRCGAHDFITKPVVPQQLWDAASWTTSPRNNRADVIAKFPDALVGEE
jgi:CheY-like chemotaxis protein